MNGAKNGVLNHIPLNNNTSIERIALCPHSLHYQHYQVFIIADQNAQSADCADKAILTGSVL